MKEFYSIQVPYIKDKNEYREKKREVVLKTIKPICEAFEITNYDYICNEEQERLVIEGTQIGCAYNSIGATVRELIVYLFVMYASDKLSNFKTQTINSLTQYWLNEDWSNEGWSNEE